MLRVELSRNELRLDATDIPGYFDKHIRTKLQLAMNKPSAVLPASTVYAGGEYIDYPKNFKVAYKYLGGKNAIEAESAAEIYAERIKYLRPSWDIGGVTYNAALKFVNFDFPIDFPSIGPGTIGDVDYIKSIP